MTTVELSPYLVLILVGFLPNEIWRALGLVLARGLNEDSEIVVWSRAVATAILAAVIGKLILFPSGTLDNIPLAVRIAAAACGFVAFICIKRSVFAAVSCRRGDAFALRFPVRALAHTVSMAAASFFACSASTSGFSFSLAGGFIVSPAFRGMT